MPKPPPALSLQYLDCVFDDRENVVKMLKCIYPRPHDLEDWKAMKKKGILPMCLNESTTFMDLRSMEMNDVERIIKCFQGWIRVWDCQKESLRKVNIFFEKIPDTFKLYEVHIVEVGFIMWNFVIPILERRGNPSSIEDSVWEELTMWIRVIINLCDFAGHVCSIADAYYFGDAGPVTETNRKVYDTKVLVDMNLICRKICLFGEYVSPKRRIKIGAMIKAEMKGEKGVLPLPREHRFIYSETNEKDVAACYYDLIDAVRRCGWTKQIEVNNLDRDFPEMRNNPVTNERKLFALRMMMTEIRKSTQLLQDLYENKEPVHGIDTVYLSKINLILGKMREEKERMTAMLR